jgi:type III restriction enzyme
VTATTAIYAQHTVNVPRIVLLPKEGTAVGFTPFGVELGSMRYAAVSDKIVIQNLTRADGKQWEDSRITIGGGLDAGEEVRLSNYVVRGLLDLPEVSYDHHADFLYALAEQVVAHLRGYLPDDEAVGRVLRVYQKQIVANLQAQIEAHRWEDATAYEVHVTQGFMSAQPQSFTVPEGVEAVDFREPVPHKREIRSMLFKGFRRGYFDLSKFDSDSERSLAVLVDRDPTVQAWLKPAKGTFQIFYSKDVRYEPDFVVQTQGEMLLLGAEGQRRDGRPGRAEEGAGGGRVVQARDEARSARRRRAAVALRADPARRHHREHDAANAGRHLCVEGGLRRAAAGRTWASTARR